MEPWLKSRVLGIAVGVAASIGMPRIAAAQQTGRMQVHVTVVDVSQSLDVLDTLRRAAESLTDSSRFTTWRLPNALLIRHPVPADRAREAGLSREEAITVFYY